MKEVVIAEYARSPFHFARKGELADIRPDDLASQVLRTVVNRSTIDPNEIEDVIMGCSYPEAEQGHNVARVSSLLAGFPETVGAMTVNRFCGSSMSSIHYAAGQIALGAGHAFLCAGIESMSRVPQGGFNKSPNPLIKSANNPDGELDLAAYMPMGITAENVAKQFKVFRQKQEAFAVQSHAKADKANLSGNFEDEIVPITTETGRVSKDGCIRPNSTIEALSNLKPAFLENGTVTAGTSSPLTDGSAATIVCSLEFAKAHGIKVLAKIRSVAIAGVAPDIMGMGPVPATKKALQRAGLSIKDIDAFELNEAFSSQAIACMEELEIDPEKVNLDGGALALGHPLGATGARITGKAAQLLKRNDLNFTLATQCIGGGQGIATILEQV